MNDDHFFVTPEYIVESLELLYLKSFFVVQNFNIALNKVDFFGAISFS